MPTSPTSSTIVGTTSLGATLQEILDCDEAVRKNLSEKAVIASSSRTRDELGRYAGA